jgi:hypothetical protein
MGMQKRCGVLVLRVLNRAVTDGECVVRAFCERMERRLKSRQKQLQHGELLGEERGMQGK